MLLNLTPALGRRAEPITGGGGAVALLPPRPPSPPETSRTLHRVTVRPRMTTTATLGERHLHRLRLVVAHARGLTEVELLLAAAFAFDLLEEEGHVVLLWDRTGEGDDAR